MSVSREKYEKAKEAVHAWHEMAEELRGSNKDLEKINATLRKQTQDMGEKISLLERDKILLEGKIQYLENALKDFKERYNELKQDFREAQTWSKKKE
jgi:predicted nuclease with TOPRIM domain